MHDLADPTTGPDLRGDAPARERPVPPRLSDAVDLARAAAVEAADDEVGQVGEALGVHAEDVAGDAPVSAATHYFAAAKPGYRGWTWAVTVMAAVDDPDAPVTLGEVALLPGTGAVVAPEWIPWNERVRAEDLAPGDLLPVEHDDDRLVPAHASLDDDVDPADDPDDAEQIRAVADELAFGRPRVMSPEGRFDAAARWSAATSARPPRWRAPRPRTAAPAASTSRSRARSAARSASAGTATSPPTGTSSTPSTAAAATRSSRSTPGRS